MNFFEKCAAYCDPDMVQAMGIYPYFRPIEDSSGSRVLVGGEEKIMIGSNNYLGMTHRPEVIQAAKEALDRYGASCTGSRLLNGNTALHEQLEEELADFLQREAVLLFTTGYQVNEGVISTIVDRNSVILCDKENHASIIEGCRLAPGKTVRYPHHNMAALERLLAKCGRANDRLVVSDGVFSMNGSISKLPELTRLSRQYDAILFIDDAHGLGVLGENGRGTAEHFGLAEDVDLLMGTFSKAFGSTGGFIAGKSDVIRFIRHKARSLLFSASMPPASAAAALKALDLIRREPELRERLHRNSERARAGLSSLGFQLGRSRTPIIPIQINGERDTVLAFAQALFDQGLFSTPVLPPAVPQGENLIRTSYMATHTDEDIDRVLDVFERVGRKFGLVALSKAAGAG
jgi:8-amino-7-oxononanoate synthase